MRVDLTFDVEDTDAITVRPIQVGGLAYLVQLGETKMWLTPDRARLLMASLGTALHLEYAQAKVQP